MTDADSPAQTRPPRHVEIAFDTGGTFTDCVVVDFERHVVHGFKVLSTPADPSIAIFEALALAQRDGYVTPASARMVLHATTVATNALIERKGSIVGLLATRGFRDVLELRRETRYDEMDLFPVFPEPLVPRHRRLGVAERVAAEGEVLIPLDEEDVRARLRELAGQGVECLAISFLHSYAHPAHELRAKAIAREEFAFDAVSTSCEVQPELREYERTSTTAANAYLQKKVRHYVGGLGAGLRERGYAAPLRIMQSNGGFAGPETSGEFPVRLVESGPAAGTIAAIHFGRRAGCDRLVSFDMGGTTAKFAVLTGEVPPIAPEIEVARVHRFKAGSGLPLRSPSVALNEIGAGGGSIAHIDGVGLLRVGPQSAGADPGPVCYARGGRAPTVTDADLVLGYLAPDYFAGGTMRLDLPAARRAIEEQVAAVLGMDVTRAAWGIHDIVNQNMASAARLHVLEQGEDPATFTMVAFGGAGPVHAHRVAAALGVGEVLYPLHAGVASAFGLVVAPMASNYVRTYKARVDAIDWARFAAAFAEMEARAEADFAREANAIAYAHSIDFRYVGQGFEVTVELPGGRAAYAQREVLERLLRDEYRRVFGRDVAGVALEIVNLRVLARAVSSGRSLHTREMRPSGTNPRKGTRAAYFDDAGTYVDTPVLDRLALAPGTSLAGPAIIEETDTTIVLPPAATARIDSEGNVIAMLPRRP